MTRSHILVVDDDFGLRRSVADVLASAGYEVSTAENGFDALLQLKRRVPDVLISDLNMPKMSGFELLSVVRRRFPQVSVLAVSGAYANRDGPIPSGVLADAFYSKGEDNAQILLEVVASLISHSGRQHRAHLEESAPVWLPRNGKDSHGIPFVVLTCTECLRSFPLSVSGETNAEVQETPCLFCNNPVHYIIDFSLSVASPLPHTDPPIQAEAEARARAKPQPKLKERSA